MKGKRALSSRKGRKPGASKKVGSPSTKKFGTKTFRKKGCSPTKTNAKKMAESARSNGKLARVVKNTGKGYCVYTHG